MTTHDTLTMRIPEKSGYESQFLTLLATLQEDPDAFQSFLADPSFQLIASGIPVARSLADSEFESPVPEAGPAGPESLMEMKFHWWGVDLIISTDLAKFIRRSIDSGTGLHQVDLLSGSIRTTDQVLTNQVVHDLQIFLRQSLAGKATDTVGAGVHWRVSWITWATGLPVNILLHFSSRKFSEE